MLGAIIGDIVGSRFEFNPTNDYNFELFTDDCGFTDDTICTCAIADALMNKSNFGETLHKWCRQYPHPKGSYGGRFAQWVDSDNPQPYGSFGNGSAMRVSPVGWLCYSRDHIISTSDSSADCTHNHPEGIKGARTVALAINIANIERRNNKKPSEIVKTIIKECLDFSGYNINLRKEDVINKFDETCQGTVPVALWIINQSNSFEDAIRLAVCLGADADTLGAIVGSIAEPIWGIPEDIKVKALSYLDSNMRLLLSSWRKFREIKAYNINKFIEKYINYFLNDFSLNSPTHYDLFDKQFFPNECWGLGFEMDCFDSFTKACGEDNMRPVDKQLSVISTIDNVKTLGSALFSQWRYFNHWSYSPPSDKDKEWFLTILRRMQELTK